MSDRLQRAVLSIGICVGAAILVIEIRGGFDSAPRRAMWQQPDSFPPRVQFAEFNPDEHFHLDEHGETSPANAMMLMMMGRTGAFSVPGIVQPTAESADSATTNDEAQVVGIEVAGRWRAYCISEMRSPLTHVINDVLDGVPVTVTYCDRTDCTRVFTKPEECDRPLDVGVGGFSAGQMLLHVDHRNFSQSSPDIPLHDWPFERTTWKEWKGTHPETEVCMKLVPTGLADRRPTALIVPDRAEDAADQRN